MGYPYASGDVLTATDLNASFGMVKIATIDVSGINTVDVNNIFTSQFLNYRVVIQQTSGSSTDYMYMRYRVGGATLTTSTYYEAVRYSSSSGTNSLLTGSGHTEFIVGICSAKSGYTIDFFNPAQATQCTHVLDSVVHGVGLFNTYNGGGLSDSASAKSGISLIAGSAITWSGKVIVYGYNQ
jgi:hypothetical protein